MYDYEENVKNQDYSHGPNCAQEDEETFSGGDGSLSDQDMAEMEIMIQSLKEEVTGLKVRINPLLKTIWLVDEISKSVPF